MISLRKLSSLADGTRQRKCLNLVRALEADLAAARKVDTTYLEGLLLLIADETSWSEDLRTVSREAALVCSRWSEGGDEAGMRRRINGIGHDMALELGRDWADWNAAAPADSFSGSRSSEPGDNGSYRALHPFRIYLDGLRSPFNIGSVFRTAAAFGSERIWSSPECAPATHRRAIRSAMGAVDWLPHATTSLEELDRTRTGPLFALELGGTDVRDFAFPREGTLILGSEELGVRPEYLRRAEKDAGVVSISLGGAKSSLNVGVAFGILLEHWRTAIEPKPGIQGKGVT